jgi:hypothetical protein
MAPVPARPPRDLRMDVLRGWMQVSIFVSHAAGTVFAWGIHASWGISDSSEQFVLLSGLSLGSVFALKQARDGFGAAARDLLGRVRRLWLTHLLVFFAFAAMVLSAEMFAGLPGVVEAQGWCWLVEQPWFAVPAAALLLYTPQFMDILPVFVCCMLLLPGFLWLLGRIGDAALLLPFGLYAATQVLDLALPYLGGVQGNFDILAWQALFLTGAWLGRRALLGQMLPRPRWLVALAVAVVVAGVPIRLSLEGHLPPLPLAVDAWVAKPTLGPLRLAHALALAWLVSLLVPREAAWMHGRVAQALAVVGRHSLQVFCVGLFLSWGIVAAFTLWPAHHAPLDVALVPAGALLLVAFARRREERRYRPATARA